MQTKTIKLTHQELMSLCNAMAQVEEKNRIDEVTQEKIECLRRDMEGMF